ncbi:MAG: hypothetical protein AAF471_09500, partial [Myxococcota bacterium]
AVRLHSARDEAVLIAQALHPRLSLLGGRVCVHSPAQRGIDRPCHGLWGIEPHLATPTVPSKASCLIEEKLGALLHRDEWGSKEGGACDRPS